MSPLRRITNKPVREALEKAVSVPAITRDWDPAKTCWVRPIDVVEALSPEQRDAMKEVL
jgi:hypothetical protein